MPPSVTPTVLQAHWFVPLLLVVLFGIGFLLTIASGWRALSHRFPSVTQVDGERFHFASAKIGRVPWFLVNFGGFLVLTVSSSGLGLSTHMPFRLLCPEFFVPWAQVESVEDRTTALSLRTLVRIRGSTVRIAIRGNIGQRVAAIFARVSATNAV